MMQKHRVLQGIVEQLYMHLILHFTVYFLWNTVVQVCYVLVHALERKRITLCLRAALVVAEEL
jgi:hypothetical protein